MKQADNENHIMTDDLSLKELLLLLRGYISESLRYWWIILLTSLVFGSVSVVKYLISDPEYNGKLTCIINEEVVQESNYPITVNLAQIVEISKSRKILESVFFEEGEIGGKTEFYANHIIDLYELDKKLAKKKPDFEGFRFNQKDIDQFTRAENEMLLNIYNLFIDPNFKTNNALLKNYFFEKTGIISFNLSTISEDLTIGSLLSLHNNMNAYFSNIADDYFEKVYINSKSYADSTFAALKEAELELAQYVAVNPRTTVSKFSLTELRLERNIEILANQYTEASKKVNEAKVNLNNKLAFLEIIDEPLSPITPSSQLKVKRILLLMVLGAFLALFYIISRKIIRETLNE